MSILFRGRAAPPAAEERSISLAQYAQLWSESVNGLMATVDGDTSMRHDAVFSCRTRIAQDVSMLPVDVVRNVGGQLQDVTPTPQIIAAPSALVDDPVDWRYQVIDSWLGWGNAWGNVSQTTADGRYPTRIDLLHPTQVTYVQMPGDRLRFYVNGQERFLWPEGDLWHRPAYTVPGSPIGMSPIERHAATITGGLNAGKFGADFFTAGGLPSSILTVDPPPPDIEAANRLKRRLLDITRGSREPLVLPKGTEYQQISVNPSDSQFIDSQRYTVEQVCRIFGEDPVDHGASAGAGSVTYANRVDARFARMERRQFWITKLQNALTDLIPRPQFVRLNTDATLMMTPKERHELHKLRLDSRTRTVNEVRRIEDEQPFGPEFDDPGIPAPSAHDPAPDADGADPENGGSST